MLYVVQRPLRSVSGMKNIILKDTWKFVKILCQQNAGVLNVSTKVPRPIVIVVHSVF
jgi:hypothetical protein